MSEHDDRCPCGTGETYGECCGRYLADGRRAPTAEALMRSRYTGFATGATHYLLVTWHPSTRPDLLELDDEMAWYRLDVVRTDAGGPWDDAGTVEFVAHYRLATDGRARPAARDQPLRAGGRPLAVRGRRDRLVAPARGMSVPGGRMQGCCSPTSPTTSSALATTRSRLAKRALLVDLLRRTPPEDVGDRRRGTSGGQLRQRRTGLGLALADVAADAGGRPDARPCAAVDAAFEQMSRLAGPGSVDRRGTRWRPSCSGRRPPTSSGCCAGLVTGRAAAGVARRAAARRGRRGRGRPAGRRAARRDARGRHRAGRGRRARRPTPTPRRRARRVRARRSGGPCARCWRSRRPTSTARWREPRAGPVVVDAKLDGIRIQVHRDGDDVRRVHAQPRRHHRPRAGDRRGGPGAAGVGRSCSTARRSRVGAGRPAAAVPGDRGALAPTTDADVAAATTLTPVLLRRPARRRRATCSTPRCCARLDALDAVAGALGGRSGWSPPTSTRRAAYFADVVARRPRGRRRQGRRRAVRGRPARRARGSRSSRGTRSTSSCSRSSGAPAGGRGLLSNIHLGARDPATAGS